MAIVGLMSTTLKSEAMPLRLQVPSCKLTILVLDGFREQPRSQVTPGVHGHNLLPVAPLREGTNFSSRFRVGEVGPGPMLAPAQRGPLLLFNMSYLWLMSSCLLAKARAK